MDFFGIDYSMRSPSITRFSDKSDFNFLHTHTNFLTSVKKAQKIDTKQLKGWKYPEVYDTFEERIDYISDWAMRHIDFYIKEAPPESYHVCIEGYSFGSTGQVFQIAENCGLLKHKLHRAGILFTEVPPTSLKKFATTKGNASKFFMEESFTAETGVDMKTELGLTSDNPSSDIVDSYYLCKYAYMNQKKV